MFSFILYLTHALVEAVCTYHIMNSFASIICILFSSALADTRSAFVGTEAAMCMVHALEKVSGDDQLEGILEIIASLIENGEYQEIHSNLCNWQ